MAQATQAKRPGRGQAKGAKQRRRSSGSAQKTGGGNRASGRATQKAGSATTRVTATAESARNLVVAREAAVAGTRAAGRAVSGAAIRAKTPLVAAGAALAGLGGGLAILNRTDASKSTRRMAKKIQSWRR